MKTLACLAALLLSTPALAEPAELHADAEVDPTAYVLDGYSLHVGVGWDRVRVDLGAYAMALPDAVDGSDDFSVAFDGYGVKAQYFVLEPQRGLFVGVDGGVARLRVSRDGTDLSQRRTTVGGGVHAGWRFALTEALYGTAWLGVGYSTDAGDVMLDGETYEPTRVTVFPAVHIGYRFR